MNLAGQVICLCMIVKSEASVIRRCLDSVRTIIDYWVIVDTGSSDGTQEIIRDHLTGLPGELYERPWKDFAHNRSEALALVRPFGDYTLIIDADDALEIPDGFQMPELAADSYAVDIFDTALRYQRLQLVRNTLPWRYQGVLHEFLACEGVGPPGQLPDVVMRRNHDGARRREATTYKEDVAILERALLTETDPFMISRYTFYLAQSYRDSGESEKALEKYLLRAELGFWQEEIFVGLLQAARIREALGHQEQDVINTYLWAANVFPGRAEALHGASRFCRNKSRFEEGYQLAKRGLAIAQPPGGLFVEPWIYEYGLLDELAVNGYWCERYQESQDACVRLLRDDKIPTDMRDRVARNGDFAAARLTALKESPKSGAGRDVPLDPAARARLRCAVVTPYFNEDATVLRRCLDSVREQTISVDHFVIADGVPQAWISGTGVRHIQLDKPHADYGGTPRAIGCMLAALEGYDAIALLDADNWLEPDHMQHCLEAASAVPDGICDYVVAHLRCVRPDGSAMNIVPESIEDHVDTSCFVFLKGAFHTLPIWALMPKEASVIGDRLYYQSLIESNLVRAVSSRVTVNYTSLWESHYLALGEIPPPAAKPNAGGLQIANWLHKLSNRELEISERLMQVTLNRWRDKNSPVARAKIVSFYMDNIPLELVEAQRLVLDQLASFDFDVIQIRTDRSHADALDEFMSSDTSDIVIFMDIDCIPLHSDAVSDLAFHAARGVLSGCAQRANHVENGGHVYVGPFCMALSKKLWTELGRPSFAPTDRGDVGEEMTYLCEATGRPIHMIWPSAVGEAVWDLALNVKFGFNTEYGGSFLHAFGVRFPENRTRFIARCRSLCADAKASGSISGWVKRWPAAGAGRVAANRSRSDVAVSRPGSLETDKDYWHRYTEPYEGAFDALGAVTDILEFGVLNGNSIRWLAERFPEARIVGADILPQLPGWPTSERIQYVQVDQGDRDATRKMFETLGRTYDLLVEDGSHIPQHQATCLVEGLPYVRPGKLYIVEDIHSSHPDNNDFRQYHVTGGASCLHVLLAFEHLKDCGLAPTTKVARSLASPGFFSVAEVMQLFSQIATLKMYRRSSLPLHCYRCGSTEFDYKSLRCICGTELYQAADSMAYLVQKHR